MSYNSFIELYSVNITLSYRDELTARNHCRLSVSIIILHKVSVTIYVLFAQSPQNSNTIFYQYVLKFKIQPIADIFVLFNIHMSISYMICGFFDHLAPYNIPYLAVHWKKKYHMIICCYLDVYQSTEFQGPTVNATNASLASEIHKPPQF
jgi:hypothetical protein